MCRSTCFGRLYAHHQKLTIALTAPGFTVGALVVAVLLVVVWTTTNNAATTTLQLWLYQPEAPDDGREDARNMLSDK